jgi:hypothetical protein
VIKPLSMLDKKLEKDVFVAHVCMQLKQSL